MISHIRNLALRRTIMVVFAIPLAVLNVGYAAMRGAKDGVEDFVGAWRDTWVGHRP
jgi:hypothetical protein